MPESSFRRQRRLSVIQGCSGLKAGALDDPHLALTELDSLLLGSTDMGKQCEGVFVTAQLLDLHPFSYFVNSAMVRLMDVFRAVDTANFVRLQICELLESAGEAHLEKVTSRAAFVDRLLMVCYSNDFIARALTLKALGLVMHIVPADKLHLVEQRVLEALQNSFVEPTEFRCALFSARRLVAANVAFAERLSPVLRALLVDMKRTNSVKAQLVTLFGHMHHTLALIHHSEAAVLDYLRAEPADLRSFHAAVGTLVSLYRHDFNSSANMRKLFDFYKVERRRPYRVVLLRSLRLVAERTSSVNASSSSAILTAFNGGSIFADRSLLLEVVAHLSEHLEADALDEVEVRAYMQFLSVWLAGSVCALSADTNAVVGLSDDFTALQQLLSVAMHYASTHAPSLQSATLLGLFRSVIYLAMATNAAAETSADIMDFAIEMNNLVLSKAYPLSALSPRTNQAFLKDIFVTNLQLARSNARFAANIFALILCRLEVLDIQLSLSFLNSLFSNDCQKISQMLPIGRLLEQLLAKQQLGESSQSALVERFTLGLQLLLFQQLEGVHIEVHEGVISQQIMRTASVWQIYQLTRQACRFGLWSVARCLIQSIYMLPGLSELNANWLNLVRLVAEAECMSLATVDSCDDNSIDSQMQLFCQALTCAKLIDSQQTFAQSVDNGEFNVHFSGQLVELRMNLLKACSQLRRALHVLTNRPLPQRIQQLGDAERQAVLARMPSAQQIAQCAEQFNDVARALMDVYYTCFDADAVSLTVLRLWHHVCCIMRMLCAPSDDASVFRSVADSISTDQAAAGSLEVLPLRHLLTALTESFTQCSPLTALSPQHISALHRCSKLILKSGFQLPRFFFQRLRTTVINLSVTPSTKQSNEVISVQLGTQFVISVEGVLESKYGLAVDWKESAGDKWSDRVEAIFLKVVSEAMVEKDGRLSPDANRSQQQTIEKEIPLSKSGYFQGQVALDFLIPGQYQIHLSVGIFDVQKTLWSIGPTSSFIVKSKKLQ